MAVHKGAQHLRNGISASQPWLPQCRQCRREVILQLRFISLLSVYLLCFISIIFNSFSECSLEPFFLI